MKKNIVVNFKNVISELKEKELQLCFLKGNGSTMLLKDAKGSLYDIERYYHNSYLDNLIKHNAMVNFSLIRDNEDIANINKFGEVEVWGVLEVMAFMKRQKLA